MKKMSKKELDKALDAIKELRKEKAFGGTLPYHHAMCYSMRMPSYSKWDKIPGKYVCKCCGGAFGRGDKANQESIQQRYGNFIDKEGFLVISDSTVEEMIHNIKTCRDAGFDAKLDFHCSDCIRDKQLPPMVFRFRASKQNDYTVSYPDIFGESFEKDKMIIGRRAAVRIFPLWQYNICGGFLSSLRESSHYRINYKIDLNPDGTAQIAESSLRPFNKDDGVGAFDRRSAKRDDDRNNISREWGELPFFDILKQLRFKCDKKNQEVELITENMSAEVQAFINCVEVGNIWGEFDDEATSLEMDIYYSPEETDFSHKARIWLNGLNTGMSYEGKAWQEIFDALTNILGVSTGEGEL
ncbi:MAG: hypothetical protein LBT55_05475 [Clostridiaceae bacterium]|jgi:hypothetical protein|nr:hypothetical protein [Clostridiaceae bacterium]